MQVNYNYIKENYASFAYDALNTVKEYRFSLLTDALKDLGDIIRQKTSDPQLVEIQKRATVLRGSVFALITSVALLAIGTVLGSSFLMNSGNLLFVGGTTTGFISLAGMATNNVMKSFNIKSTSSLVAEAKK